MRNEISQKSREKSDFSFVQALDNLIAGLPERSQKILKSRYGITGKKAMTLEEIGMEYKITRERVRQIINEFFKKIKSRQDSILDDIREKIELAVRKNSGIIKEDILLDKLAGSDEIERKAIRFFMECLSGINLHEADNEFEKAYSISGFDAEEWRKMKNSAKGLLEKAKKLMRLDELHRIYEGKSGPIDEKKFADYLSVSSEIKKNNFENWGLSRWGEINPRVTWQRAYLVLEHAGKPLHFREIARLIDRHNLGKRKAHPQTVHNELIKDKRFVLVGRGVYALSEWGYKKGTVKEVLEDILSKKGAPMKKSEILDEILKMRQVKKSTILINLNNFFVKVDKDRYSVGK